MPRVLAFFHNAASGNLTIQLLTGLGIPADKLGVTPPDRMENNQGMLLSIPCPDESKVRAVEALCRKQGAEVHRQGA